MQDEDKTKEQLISELTELQQKIIELEIARKNQSHDSTVPSMLSPSNQFSVGNHEPFVPFNYGYQQSDNNLRTYHISELIDIPLLQQLFDSFYELTGIMHAFLDVGTNILSRTGWSDLCLKFHRVCPQTECRCKQSDGFISSHLQDGPYIRYRCLNGLIDYATPIIVEGQHLATIYMGQLLNEEPDEEYFRKQAKEFGFDEAAYIEALHKINIVPEHRIKPIMEFYSKLGQVLASMGVERLHRIEEANYALREREERLRQTEDKFSKAFHCNPDPMSIITLKEGHYVEVNDAFLKATGYRENEVIGHTIWELDMWVVTEEDIIIKQIHECRSISNIETKFRLKSGEIRTALVSVEIIDIDGEAHLIATTRDITERKRMEEALRLSEESFSKAFNASPVSMTITALEDGRIIKANNAYYNILGFSREEAIGQTLSELGFWSEPSDRYLLKQRIRTNQSVQGMEIKFHRNTGEQRVGVLSAERIDVHGEPCILSILTDITELRQMEIEMTRLDRLNLVGEMAASIGHEIRNPMTTVRGYLQLLQENKDYHQEIEYFDLMIEELDRANSIITEFLSLAKNKMVELKGTSLNTIISKLLPLVQARAMSRDQQIKVELDDLPDLLLDNKEIRQLILNLVNNGMESMSSSGDVIIRTFIEKEKVVLAVQDQGHGIDSELLNKLGTPFFTTKEQGTGLGLAVCYRIAARHNAQIDLDTSSTGTTFYVRFPSPITADIIS